MTFTSVWLLFYLFLWAGFIVLFILFFYCTQQLSVSGICGAWSSFGYFDRAPLSMDLVRAESHLMIIIIVLIMVESQMVTNCLLIVWCDSKKFLKRPTCALATHHLPQSISNHYIRPLFYPLPASFLATSHYLLCTCMLRSPGNIPSVFYIKTRWCIWLMLQCTVYRQTVEVKCSGPTFGCFIEHDCNWMKHLW